MKLMKNVFVIKYIINLRLLQNMMLNYKFTCIFIKPCTRAITTTVVHVYDDIRSTLKCAQVKQLSRGIQLN